MQKHDFWWKICWFSWFFTQFLPTGWFFATGGAPPNLCKIFTSAERKPRNRSKKATDDKSDLEKSDIWEWSCVWLNCYVFYNCIDLLTLYFWSSVSCFRSSGAWVADPKHVWSISCLQLPVYVVTVHVFIVTSIHQQ